METVLYWIAAGAVTGFLARAFAPPQRPSSVLGYLIVGIMGAVMGGFLVNLVAASLLGWTGNSLFAAVGAVVLFCLRGRRQSVQRAHYTFVERPYRR